MSRRMKLLKPEVHAISDKSKLLWQSYYTPMQTAAQALNAAIQNTQNIIAAAIIVAEGFSQDTHVFDMDRMVIVKRPVRTENGQ